MDTEKKRLVKLADVVDSTNQVLFLQTKEKPPHGPRDKSEVAVTGPSDKTCSCGSDMTNNGLQATCSNPVCIKNRDNDMSLAQRLSSSHIKLSLGGERQNISGNTPNAPGPPKDLNKVDFALKLL